MSALNPYVYAVTCNRLALGHHVRVPLYGANGSTAPCLQAIARKRQLRALQLTFCNSAATYRHYLFKSLASCHTLHCRLA